MPRRPGESVFRKSREPKNTTSSSQEPASDCQSSGAHQSSLKGPLSAENGATTDDNTPTNNSTSSTRERSPRFSTKSADARKPWLGGSSTSSPEGGRRKSSVPRTSSSDHVLHAPRSFEESTTPTATTSHHDESNQTLEEDKSFDDLWDESAHASDGDVERVPSKKASKAGMATKELDTRRFASHGQKPAPEKIAKETLQKSESSASSRKKPPPEDKLSEKRPESSSATKELDTRRFATTDGKTENPPVAEPEPETEATPMELDTRRFAKKTKVITPPNTPIVESHAVAEDSKEDAAQEDPVKREQNPIRHRRTDSQDSSTDKPHRTPRRTNSKDSASSDNSHNGQRHPRKIKHATGNEEEAKGEEESEKPKKKVYKDKDVAIATLEKQLERVSFLQRRQYDQLSSLKQMLLASRAKEREHVDTNEELGKVLEDKEARIEELEQQMQNQSSIRDLRQTLKEKEARIKQLEKNPIPAMKYPSEDIEKKLKVKDDKIAELQRQLETKESELGNALAVTESKLKKKSQNHEHLRTEVEEMRTSLTKAQTTIETLEEERNFSQAKMSELNEMVKQKGGMTDTDTELLERAAEIANLSSKLKGLDGKIQERDDKVYKLEEQMKSISDLVKQLSDIFCAEDDQLKYQQDLLVESAESPGQSCSLLLMTMMNMLETMKTKMATLKQERDDSNAKASDRGIQLAESHIRVDKLRTELRRLRAERARFVRGTPNPNGGRGAPNPNGGRGPPQQGGTDPQGRSVTPNQGTQNNNDATPRRSNVQSNQRPPQHHQQPPEQRRNSFGNKLHNGSERSHQSRSSISTAPPLTAVPPAQAQPKNRFMNFIKNNLKLEEEPTTRGNNGNKPLVART